MIPVNEPIFFGNEKKYLNECIDSGWISSDGPFVSLFEKKLATYFNRKFAIAVSNGTVALDLAVESLNLKRGDEIILPSFDHNRLSWSHLHRVLPAYGRDHPEHE